MKFDDVNQMNEVFSKLIEDLREKMKNNLIDISVGESWRNSDVNITEQMHIADKLMYMEKMRHYELQNE